MVTAKTGDTVEVHYTARLPDGTEVHTTRNGSPTRFMLGAGDVLAGFAAAVEGMEPGEEKSVWVSADRAFGPRRDDLMLTVPQEYFPADLLPELGQRWRMRRQGADPVMVTVVDVQEEGVVVDGNHPLAGLDLIFDLELIEITGRIRRT